MVRKNRSNCTIVTPEKYGLPAGTIRNKDGHDTCSDKRISTIRRKAERKSK